MSHAIHEGPVKLLKIVSPGAYWIKCAGCDDSSKLPSSIKHKLNGLGNESYFPHQGDKVFVRDDEGFFYRGTICGRRHVPRSENNMFSCTWKYVVQLTDTFQVKDFYQHDVYPTYGESSASCSSCHLICLYFLLPKMPPSTYGKCVKIGTDEHRLFENAVICWDQSLRAMTHLMEGKLKFSFAQSKLINCCVYGELSIFPPLLTKSQTECYTLSDYLHHEKLAARITFRFDDIVQALMSNHLIDYSEMLPTFDPTGKTSFQPKPSPPSTNSCFPMESELAGLGVHPDDLPLYQSLVHNKRHCINIVFRGAPLEDDTVIRYVTVGGKVVLGTVITIDLKECEIGSNYQRNEKSRSPLPINSFHNEYLINGMSHVLDNLDTDFSDDSSEEVGNSMMVYNFEDTHKHFKAMGGLFEEQFRPYPHSLSIEASISEFLNSVGFHRLHEWQTLCLPSYSSRKNLLVVGPKSMGKLSTAVICALSWMEDARRLKIKALDPQLIIFFLDLDRADKTAIMCTRLTNFHVIVSTSSIITQRQKEIAKNGCDILITTPSNWAKLVSIGVFGYSGLKHVIFDQFDCLFESYEEDVVNLLNVFKSQSGNRIQNIVVSNTWREPMRSIIADSTLCIMDAFLTCMYHQLTLAGVFVGRDYRMELDSILTQPGKLLLLCQGKFEGESILKEVSRSTDISFLHEELDESIKLKMLNRWSCSVSHLLICTDVCFEDIDIIKNVDVLISWRTINRETLSSRFRASAKNLSSEGNRSLPLAYLACHSQNLEELLLIQSVVPKISFVTGSLEEHIKRASFASEKAKQTPICPSIYMFGKCDLEPTCPNRHLFSSDDDPQSSHLTQYLQVKILKVHSAFRYSVRVENILCNYDQRGVQALMGSMFRKLTPLVSALKIIEKKLMNCDTKPCSPSFKIGEMVGVATLREKKVLKRRAIIRKIPEDVSSGLFSVRSVDYVEPDMHLPLSELFVLPQEVAQYPRDVIDVYLSGMFPKDFRSDWKNDTSNFVLSEMKLRANDSGYLAGKVHMVTAERSVLVDSLLLFKDGPKQKYVKSIVNSEFLTLKDLILESGYCIKNDAHLPLLSTLLMKSVVPSYDSISKLRVTYSRHYLLESHIGKFGYHKEFHPLPIQGVVSIYDDPGLLYVQLNKDFDKFENLEKELCYKMNQSQEILNLIAVHEFCAYRYQGSWNRAVILDVVADEEGSPTAVHLLCVDYGDYVMDVQPNELYRLPYEFVCVPFFSILCELVGIKPLRGKVWHESAMNEFRSCVRHSDNTMKTLIIKFVGRKDEDDISKFCFKEKVVLWELGCDESINYRLARCGLASFDPETKHLLKQ